MKVTEVEAIIIRVPKDYVSSTGLRAVEPGTPERIKALSSGYESGRHIVVYPSVHQTTLVKITTDDGLIGWGEAHAPVAPEVTREIINGLLAPLVIGQDPRNVEMLWEKMYSTMRLRGHSTGFMTEAIAGIDIALWGLFGKAMNLPLYQLLGGRFRERIKAYASGIPGQTIEERQNNARKFMDEGFTAMKISIGRGNFESDIDMVAMVSEVLEGKADLLVDAHGAYDLHTAIKVGRALEKAKVYWFEDPLYPEDHAGYAQLAATLDLAVAAGEAECNRFQFRDRFASRAIDIALPDVCRAGGITECKRIAILADSFNIPWAAHVSIGSPIHLAASIHLGAATPNFLICEYPSGPNPIGNNLLVEPLVCKDGYLEIPQNPGLGITFREEELARFIVK